MKKRKEKKRKRNQRESSNNGSLHSPTSPDLLTRMIDAVDQPSQAQTNQAFYSSQLVSWLLQIILYFHLIFLALRSLPCGLKRERKEKKGKSVMFRPIYLLLSTLTTNATEYSLRLEGSLFAI